MNKLRILKMILKRTHTTKIAVSYAVAFFIVAIFIQMVEPEISTYGDSLWYCYVATATIGFGDIVAVTVPGRILTVYLSLHATLFLAIIPAVIVSYYLEVVHRREKESATIILDKLEHLPEMSKEELQKISDRVKQIKLK